MKHKHSTIFLMDQSINTLYKKNLRYKKIALDRSQFLNEILMICKMIETDL